MNAIEEPHRRALIKEYVHKYPEDVQAALSKSAQERSALECMMVAKARQYLDPDSHQYLASTAIIAAQLKGEEKTHWSLSRWSRMSMSRK